MFHDLDPIDEYQADVRRELRRIHLKELPAPENIALLRQSETALGEGWYRSVKNLQWFDRADQLGLFVEEVLEFPSTNNTFDREEKKLHSWYSIQRRAATTMSEARFNYMEYVAPGWNTSLVSDSRSWWVRAYEFVEWTKKYPILPRSSSGNAEERGLGVWLHEARWRADYEDDWGRWRDGEAYPASDQEKKRRAFLDEHVPGWRGSKTPAA